MSNTVSLAELNRVNPNTLPDALRCPAQAGFGLTAKLGGLVPPLALGDLINALIAKANAVTGGQVAAAQTVTIGGTFAAGGVITLKADPGDGNLLPVSYTVVAGDTTLNGAAASLAAALNANAAFAAAFTAAAAAAVVTVTAKRKGPGMNGKAFTLTTATMGTLTATAGAATFAGGTGQDDILPIV